MAFVEIFFLENLCCFVKETSVDVLSCMSATDFLGHHRIQYASNDSFVLQASCPESYAQCLL